MMRLSLFLCLGLGLVGTGWGRAQDVPMHQGRPLDQWLADLKDKDGAVRQKAAQAVATLGAKATAATPVVIALLKDDKDAYNRLLAAYMLEHIKPDPTLAVDPLIEALRDKDGKVGQQSAKALVKIGADVNKKTAALVALLKEKETEPRLWAAYVLGGIQPDPKEVTQALTILALSDPVEDVKKVAAQSLKRINPEAAKNAGIP